MKKRITNYLLGGLLAFCAVYAGYQVVAGSMDKPEPVQEMAQVMPDTVKIFFDRYDHVMALNQDIIQRVTYAGGGIIQITDRNFIIDHFDDTPTEIYPVLEFTVAEDNVTPVTYVQGPDSLVYIFTMQWEQLAPDAVPTRIIYKIVRKPSIEEIDAGQALVVYERYETVL